MNPFIAYATAMGYQGKPKIATCSLCRDSGMHKGKPCFYCAKGKSIKKDMDATARAVKLGHLMKEYDECIEQIKIAWPDRHKEPPSKLLTMHQLINIKINEARHLKLRMLLVSTEK